MAGELDPKTGLPVETKPVEPVTPVTGTKPDAGAKEDKDKQIAGLIKEVQEDRVERKQMKEQMGAMQDELADRDRQLALAQEASATKPTDAPEVPDAEFFNAGQTKQLLENQKKTILDEVSGGVAILEDRVWNLSKKEAQRTYSEERVGKELAFDAVLAKTAALAKANPALREQILRSKEPAEEAYRIGLTHMDIQTYLKSQGATELANKLREPKPRSTTSKGAGGTSPLAGMSLEQLATEVPLETLLAEAKK